MRIFSRRKLALALFCAGVFAVGPAVADKPEWAGHGKPGKGAKEGKKGGSRGAYFDDRHRTAAREYFDESFRAGRCPPGLAKKHNGCLPPGQAKKWSMGRPLPRDVVFYDLPPTVVVRLGPPPTGHRFVRVANDILLIAIGSGIVIDAIQDLGR